MNNIIFVICVVIAFCAWVAEKMVEMKISDNIRLTAIQITKQAHEEKPRFSTELSDLLQKNKPLQNWTAGLFVLRTILLTVGAVDYFWFM